MNSAFRLLAVVVLMSALTACNDNDNKNVSMKQVNNTVSNTFDNPYNHNINAKFSGSSQLYTVNDVRSAQILAARAMETAQKVPGVNRAIAIAQGNDIVVGIEGTQGTKAKEIEQKVIRSIKGVEPGYNVYATANSVISERIRTLFTNMNNVKTSFVMPGISTIIYEIGRAERTS